MVYYSLEQPWSLRNSKLLRVANTEMLSTNTVMKYLELISNTS